MATTDTYTLRIDNKDTNGVLTLQWVRTSFSVEDKTATINWRLNATLASSRTLTYKLNIAGETFTQTLSNGTYTKQQVDMGYITIPYDNTGNSVNFGVSITAESKGFLYKATKSGTTTFVLDGIPLPAKIYYAEDFTDEVASVPIMYSSSLYTDDYSLQACISFTGANDDVPYRDITKNGGTYYFVLTDEERATLRQGITYGNNTTVRFYVRTEINGTYYYSYLTKTLTLKNYLPTCSPVIVDTNARTTTLTGSNSKFIKYFSYAQVQINAEAQKEASIISRTIINGTQTQVIEDAATDTALFENIDSNTFYFTIQDSRGYETKDFKVIDIVDYIKLTAAVNLLPLTLAGNLTFEIEGNYYNGSFGAASNSLEFEYGLRENGGDINWTIIDTSQGTLTISGNTYKFTYTITGLNPDSTYTITTNVIDELTTIQTTEQSIVAKPLFSWGKTDFKHNTPVYFDKDIYIKDEYVADYVIETGNDGIYAYRKWSSGLLEAWRMIANGVSVYSSAAYGALYYHDSLSLATSGGASQFVSVENISLTLRKSGYGFWQPVVTGYGISSGTVTVFYLATNPVQNVSATIYPYVYITGRWK